MFGGGGESVGKTEILSQSDRGRLVGKYGRQKTTEGLEASGPQEYLGTEGWLQGKGWKLVFLNSQGQGQCYLTTALGKCLLTVLRKMC